MLVSGGISRPVAARLAAHRDDGPLCTSTCMQRSTISGCAAPGEASAGRNPVVGSPGQNDRVHTDQTRNDAAPDAEVRMLTTSVVYADQWLTFRRDEIERRDGSRGTYAYVREAQLRAHHPGRERRLPPGRGVPLPARAARLVVPAGRLPARRVGHGRGTGPAGARPGDRPAGGPADPPRHGRGRARDDQPVRRVLPGHRPDPGTVRPRAGGARPQVRVGAEGRVRADGRGTAGSSTTRPSPPTRCCCWPSAAATSTSARAGPRTGRRAPRPGPGRRGR